MNLYHDRNCAAVLFDETCTCGMIDEVLELLEDSMIRKEVEEWLVNHHPTQDSKQ